MKTRLKITDSYTKDLKQLNKKTRKIFLIYILLAAIMISLVMGISIFTIPKLIQAYTIPNSVVTPYNMRKANLILKQSVERFQKNDDNEITRFEKPKVKPVYNSPVNWYLYEGIYSYGTTAAYKAWSHANDLYANGLIYGAEPYQCTFFAQMWFYDIYGFNATGYSASGNGDAFASRVYAINTYYDEEGNLNHWFKYDDHPEALGLVSISGHSPHILCVDEVDYENGTITISDGNVDGGGGVRIRKTYTMQEFYAVNPGYYTFVNPTPQLLHQLRNR